MDPATISAIASVGSSILGGLAGGGAAKTQERLAKDAVRIAGTAYSPISIFGPGGMGVSFGAGGTSGGGTGGFAQGDIIFPGAGDIRQIAPGYRQVGKYGIQSDIGSVNLNLGDLTNPRNQLGALAGQLSGNAGLQGLSPLQLLGIGLSGQGAQYAGVDASTLNSLLGLTGAGTGNAFNEMQGAYANPFQAALQQSLFGGAGQQFADASQGFGDYRQQTLDLLRQEAKPEEDRALANLQNTLFAQGRLGSSGGGLQMEAFARGLGQADLARQLAAGQEARAAQSQALNVGTGLAGQGLGLQEMQNNILQGSLGRFNVLASLAQNLSNARQSQAFQGAQYGTGLFGLGQQALTSPYAVQQAGPLESLSRVLGLSGDIQSQGVQLAELANLFMSNQASTRTGQATAAGTAGLGASAGDRYKADLFNSLGAALGGDNPLGTALGGIADLFRIKGTATATPLGSNVPPVGYT